MECISRWKNAKNMWCNSYAYCKRYGYKTVAKELGARWYEQEGVLSLEEKEDWERSENEDEAPEGGGRDAEKLLIKMNGGMEEKKFEVTQDMAECYGSLRRRGEGAICQY